MRLDAWDLPWALASKERSLELAVGSVAQGLVPGRLASAEPDLCRFRRLINDRRDAGTGVRPITQGLLLAAPAGTPEVVPARFHSILIGRFLRGNGVRHTSFFHHANILGLPPRSRSPLGPATLVRPPIEHKGRIGPYSRPGPRGTGGRVRYAFTISFDPNCRPSLSSPTNVRPIRWSLHKGHD